MIGQEHYPILNNCVFNWSLGSTYIIYMLLISWAIVQIPYNDNDNDKIRYKIIQSWQYISFQQRDWWCNITLYWLLKRLFQLYSTGERQTKGERRCFLRLKPIVYVYDNVYDKTKNQNHIIFLGSTKGVFRWRRNVFIAKVETISRVQTKFGRDSNPPLNLQLRAL